MALVKEVVEGFTGGKAMEDYPIANTKFIGQFMELGEFRSIPGNVEYYFRHSIMRADTPDKPVEPVPAADIGDAEEMKIAVVVRSLP